MNGKNKSYILDPAYRKITEFTLSEINNKTYFKVKSITKWYMFNELGLPRYKNTGALLYTISAKVSRILKELVNLKVIEKDGTRYRNLYKGNIRNAVDEQIDKNYHIIKLRK